MAALGTTPISSGLSTPFKADSPAVSAAADTAKRVQKVVKAEISSPLDDMRASSNYRLAEAKNLLLKAFYEIKNKQTIRIN